MRPLISDKWSREYHCERSSGFKDGIILTPYTFCGVLEELYKTVSKGWNNDTRVKYDRDYDKIILPHISNHNSKLISDYTKQDCDEILESIKRDGYKSGKLRRDYSDSQMNHFKYLIFSVFNCAASVGYCHSFLWGTKFSINKDRESIAILSKTQIKRSLSIKQEKDLIEAIMSSPDEDGSLIALLLMFSLGLRDGEACGLDFGDIYKLPYYPGCYVAVVKQSTIPNTSILQSSGKSWNSGRKIPIPTKVLSLILERKKLIEDIIAKNNLDLDISRVPVACKGYIQSSSKSFPRLKADNVTDKARELFISVKIDSEVLASLEIEMEEEVERLEVTESEVTAYLLRRNFATHLKILGLDYPDIQYLLGHCIDDPYVNRPDYTDSKLYQLSLQMKRRPLINEPTANLVSVQRYTESEFSGKRTLQLISKTKEAHVRISALEKRDWITVKICNAEQNNLRIKISEEYKAYEPHKSIDITRKYMEDYL